MRHIRSINPGTTPLANPTPWEWADNAACKAGDTSLFFEGDPEQARNICKTCPTTVRRACLDYALDNERYGMWGGFTADERTSEKRRRWRGYTPRYTPPAPPKPDPAEPSRSVTTGESIRLLREMFDAGLSAQQVADASDVSLRVISRLRKTTPPEGVLRVTEDKLRAAHKALIGARARMEAA